MSELIYGHGWIYSVLHEPFSKIWYLQCILLYAHSLPFLRWKSNHMLHFKINIHVLYSHLTTSMNEHILDFSLTLVVIIVPNGTLSCLSRFNNYVSPSNEGRHIVLVWFFLLPLLLSEACPDHNFFVFPDRSIIFDMWVHDHKAVCRVP